MQNNVELELLTRPNDGTTVSLVARRLSIALLDERTGEMHDHRIQGDGRMVDGELPDTVAPSGGLAWHTDTRMVWNRTEWVERHGSLPVAFEMRVPVDASVGFRAAHELGRVLAAFVAHRLEVPVTYVVLEGTGPWPMREPAGQHVRLCFPTRSLSGPAGHSVLDRSGNPSGFGPRLAVATNARLSKRLTMDVAQEVVRLLREGLPVPAKKPSPYLPRFEPDPFDIDLPFDDLLGLDGPLAAPETDPAVHPHVARLRREAPRGIGLQDLRDFEVAMSFATTVENSLKAVTVQEHEHDKLDMQRVRLDAQVLDNSYQLDLSRAHRERVGRELEDLKAQKGLIAFFKGRMQVASLARQRKADELALANLHVQELKATIARQKAQTIALRRDLMTSHSELEGRRGELKSAVTGLHKSDPQVLAHFLAFLQGAERTCLKSAMSKVIPQVTTAGEAGSDQAEGQSGPPARPARGLKGPAR